MKKVLLLHSQSRWKEWKSEGGLGKKEIKFFESLKPKAWRGKDTKVYILYLFELILPFWDKFELSESCRDMIKILYTMESLILAQDER